MFVVPVDAPGVVYQPIETALVSPDKQFTLFLDDVVVGPEALIGEAGKGLRQVFAGLNPERIVAAAISDGIGRYAMAKAAQYANERQVWATPIGAHQGISHPLAKAHIAVELAPHGHGAQRRTLRCRCRMRPRPRTSPSTPPPRHRSRPSISPSRPTAATAWPRNTAWRSCGSSPACSAPPRSAARWCSTSSPRPPRPAPLVLEENFMTDNTLEFDALVIGAGAGGLFTAARLQHAGYRTLVVERLDKVGGRASTDDIDGFKVNNGAIVIETGGITEETFEEVGAPFDIRSPQPPILYRLGGKDVDVTGGGWGFLLGKLTRQGAKLVKGIGSARNDSGLPEDEMSTAEWVSKYTKNEGVHGIFRNMCASVFAVGSEDLPARVFLTYFTRKSAFKTFGFCPEGTIGIWKSLAEAFAARRRRAVAVQRGHEAIVVDGARSRAPPSMRDGETVEVDVPVRGQRHRPRRDRRARRRGATCPPTTSTWCRRGDRPTSMITVNFASQEQAHRRAGHAELRQDPAPVPTSRTSASVPRDGAARAGTCTSAPRCRSRRSVTSTRRPRRDPARRAAFGDQGIRRGAGSCRSPSPATVGRPSVPSPASTCPTRPPSRTCGTSATASRSTPTAARPRAPRRRRSSSSGSRNDSRSARQPPPLK